MPRIEKITSENNWTRYIFWCEGCKKPHQVNDSWQVDLEAETITPSILVNRGGANPTQPICHSFVTRGMIEYLSDSTHELAGQMIPLSDLKRVSK